MITITTANPTFKTRSILHLVLSRYKNDPQVQQVMLGIKADTSQILSVNEQLMIDARFNSFETVVLHGVRSIDEVVELKNILEKMDYIPKLLKVKEDPKRRLLVLGESIKMLPPKILHIYKDRIGKHNGNIRSTGYNSGSIQNGLNFINFQIDIDFNPSEKQGFYARNLRDLSMRFPLFLLTPRVVYSDRDNVRNGDVYYISEGKLKKVKSLPDNKNTGENKIPSITALYEPEKASTEEKEVVEQNTSREE